MTVGWVDLLQRYARRVHPLLGDLLEPRQYDRVTAHAEYSTDLVFTSRSPLRDRVPRLLEHSTRSFTAQAGLAFLGRTLHGKFEGEVLTALRAQERKGRLPGHRVTHRMQPNWITMDDTAGLGLRIETVITAPEECRVRRRGRRRGRRRTEWVPLRKGVASLFRSREICLHCNAAKAA